MHERYQRKRHVTFGYLRQPQLLKSASTLRGTRAEEQCFTKEIFGNNIKKMLYPKGKRRKLQQTIFNLVSGILCSQKGSEVNESIVMHVSLDRTRLLSWEEMMTASLAHLSSHDSWSCLTGPGAIKVRDCAHSLPFQSSSRFTSLALTAILNASSACSVTFWVSSWALDLVFTNKKFLRTPYQQSNWRAYEEVRCPMRWRWMGSSIPF